jgi:hypothetical protein
MRIIFKLLLGLSLAIISACSQSSVGNFEIKVSGLPTGTNPNITVTSPGGFNQAVTLSGSTVISDLPVGVYTVTAKNVTVGSTTYASTVTGSPANVTSGTTSSVGVVYGALRTITGKLINNAGIPITPASITLLNATLNVKLLGSTGNAVLDANGGFTLTDVPATYSLLVSASVTGGRFATVFQGLTRANPTLTFAQGPFSGPSISGPSNFKSISGKVTGGLGFNAGSTATTLLTLGLPKAVSLSTSNFSSVDPTIGDYGIGASWSGPDSVPGILHALQFSTNASGQITYYSGYIQKSITLTKDGPIDPGQPIPTQLKQNLALEPVTSGSIKGLINWPSGFAAPEYEVSTKLLFAGPEQTNLPLAALNGTPPNSTLKPTSYDQLVPLIAGAKFIQRISINEKPVPGSFGTRVGSSVSRFLTPGVNTDITVPAPISLTLPEENATNVNTNTKFSWSAYSGGIHIVNFYTFPGSSTVQTFVQVITAASSTTIPDLGDLLPKGAFILWAVQGFAPYSSIDVATDTAGLISAFSFSTPLIDIDSSISASRTFKTAAN